MPVYASPEMLESREPNPRDDVFALACVSYELLTGEHPFQHMRSNSARDLGLKVERWGELTHAQWQAFQTALEFDREKRAPAVNTFLSELNAVERPWWVFAAAAVGIVGVVALNFVIVVSKSDVAQLPVTGSPEFTKIATAKPADPTQSLITAGLQNEDQGIQRSEAVPQGATEQIMRAATPIVTENGVTGAATLAIKRQVQATQQLNQSLAIRNQRTAPRQIQLGNNQRQ